MGNAIKKPKGNATATTIQSCAVNVEKELAFNGQHLDQMCVLDKLLFCAVQTKGVADRQVSGAFLWYLCSPEPKQLTQLSALEDWSNRLYTESKDVEGRTFVRKVNRLSHGTDVLICQNDINLSVGDENIWDQLNREDRDRVEMTMSSTFDLSQAASGLVAGMYRVDFYLSNQPFTSTFYNQSNFPPTSKTIHFECK